MSLKFKNRATEKVATVLEPQELRAHLETVTKRGRPLDKGRIALAVKRRKRTIEKMGDSWKWQRVDAPQTDQEPDQDPSTSVEVRDAGGGWYELVADGEVVDKVRGREAADAAVAELTGA